MLQRVSSLEPLLCAECGRVAGPGAYGGRAYRSDIEEGGDPPEIAFFCPTCAELEFET